MPAVLFLSNFLVLILLLLPFSYHCFSPANLHRKNSDRNLVEATFCPLNFNSLLKLINEAPPKRALVDVPNLCHQILEGSNIVRSEYLRTNAYFSPPPEALHSCWDSYRDVMKKSFQGVDIQTTCGYHPEWFSNSCGNFTSQEQFERQFPLSGLQEMRLHCDQSLDNGVACESCKSKMLNLGKSYLQVSNCSDSLFMYAAAAANHFGPTNPATAKCFFNLQYSSESMIFKPHKAVTAGVVIGCLIGIVGGLVGIWILWRVCRNFNRENNDSVELVDASPDSGLVLRSRSTHLVKFKIEEIREATMNFSRQNIVGIGGYGNVYKGVLPDGSEIAFKRFRSCSASNDGNFAHELEVIASIKHVNLVPLRGYCTATDPTLGLQRIILCDLMQNGSLYDHLFGSGRKKLTWPIRLKIALGTARGLAYLHYGVHPAIIHRDIKASNILLDETFEAKVADFGLARVNSQGMTHMSTGVAGTIGYVSPEYALYGKLTEKSDVYSFGVVLLELLSGIKAYQINDEKVSLLTDYAWQLTNEGRALDFVEENLPESGPPEVMEHYVHIALICAHPVLQARPRMDQIVNILERDVTVSSSLESYISASINQVSGYSSTDMCKSSFRRIEQRSETQVLQ